MRKATISVKGQSVNSGGSGDPQASNAAESRRLRQRLLDLAKERKKSAAKFEFDRRRFKEETRRKWKNVRGFHLGKLGLEKGGEERGWVGGGRGGGEGDVGIGDGRDEDDCRCGSVFAETNESTIEQDKLGSAEEETAVVAERVQPFSTDRPRLPKEKVTSPQRTKIGKYEPEQLEASDTSRQKLNSNAIGEYSQLGAPVNSRQSRNTSTTNNDPRIKPRATSRNKSQKYGDRSRKALLSPASDSLVSSLKAVQSANGNAFLSAERVSSLSAEQKEPSTKQKKSFCERRMLSTEQRTTFSGEQRMAYPKRKTEAGEQKDRSLDSKEQRLRKQNSSSTERKEQLIRRNEISNDKYDDNCNDRCDDNCNEENNGPGESNQVTQGSGYEELVKKNPIHDLRFLSLVHCLAKIKVE